jgi:hypothetical protein
MPSEWGIAQPPLLFNQTPHGSFVSVSPTSDRER